MAYNPVSGFTLQTITQTNEIASDYYLKFYEANTTTPLSMATDATASTLLSEAKLGDKGMPISNPIDNNTIFIPYLNQNYRLVIYPAKADADANNTSAAYVNIADVEAMLGADRVGLESADIPTNGNLSTTITGTATFSSDTYTFSPSGTGFRALEAGMYISFVLPTGSVNTTTTPDIDYNGTSYTIKWIDGSALAANDLDVTYNKHPILFYFDGTDMLIASDISGSNSNGDWEKRSNGDMVCQYQSSTSYTTSSSKGSLYFNNGEIFTFPKQFSSNPIAVPNNKGGSGDAAIGNFSFSLSTSGVRIGGTGVLNTDTFSPGYIAKGRWY